MFRLMIIDWTNKDATILKKFLDSETGRKFVAGFKATEPDMDATTIEGRALQAATFSQWRADKRFAKNAMELQPESTEKDNGIPVEGLDVVE